MFPVLAAAVADDFITGKIHNPLILAGLLAGAVRQVSKYGIRGAWIFLAGAAAPLFILFVVYLFGGLGAGDLKLLSAIGGVLGVRAVISCIFASLIVGSIVSVLKLLWNKAFIRCFNNLIQYFTQVCLNKRGSRYPREQWNTIHFSLPISISVLCYMGGWI